MNAVTTLPTLPSGASCMHDAEKEPQQIKSAAVHYPDGNEALYGFSHGAVADVRLSVGGMSRTP